MESPASVCGFWGKHGTVTKDDWRHIVNKHPSLSQLASQSLHRDVPYSTTFHLFMLRIVYH